MKHIYTDTRGLIIPEDRVEEELDYAKTTEDKVLEFLGEEYALLPGAFQHLVHALGVQRAWIEDRFRH